MYPFRALDHSPDLFSNLLGGFLRPTQLQQGSDQKANMIIEQLICPPATFKQKGIKTNTAIGHGRPRTPDSNTSLHRLTPAGGYGG